MKQRNWTSSNKPCRKAPKYWGKTGIRQAGHITKQKSYGNRPTFSAKKQKNVGSGTRKKKYGLTFTRTSSSAALVPEKLPSGLSRGERFYSAFFCGRINEKWKSFRFPKGCMEKGNIRPLLGPENFIGSRRNYVPRKNAVHLISDRKNATSKIIFLGSEKWATENFGWCKHHPGKSHFWIVFFSVFQQLDTLLTADTAPPAPI